MFGRMLWSMPCWAHMSDCDPMALSLAACRSVSVYPIFSLLVLFLTISFDTSLRCFLEVSCP